ncbi:probable ascorbate-specific transmembrane electron transporter 1 [Phalaenopsis equestris]|uniref:probable ascorbate-specific transmembrane electron transporter 1 n=1 Tax=Phalaenopsis equestris TaxID=78828 RepID=UPI0009E253D0|nr:probable ascorbate-specific transmembrane electron transporter 1 [Phalaenopsis equestris]
MAYSTIPSPKRVQKMIHMLLHLVALGLGILGIYAAFKFHKESQIPNMYTLHSWLGISTICLFALQWIFGFFSFWFPGAPPMMRATLVPLHSTAGLAIFLTAICTVETGLMEKGAGSPGRSETLLINFAGLIILLFGLFVCLSTALPRIMPF